VDLLYSFSTCCEQVENLTPRFRFVVDFLSSPQQIHNVLTCRDVVDLSKSREAVDLLYIKLYSKSTTIEQVEFELNRNVQTVGLC
jgi:hypothetical protein